MNQSAIKESDYHETLINDHEEIDDRFICQSDLDFPDMPCISTSCCPLAWPVAFAFEGCRKTCCNNDACDAFTHNRYGQCYLRRLSADGRKTPRSDSAKHRTITCVKNLKGSLLDRSACGQLRAITKHGKTWLI